MRGIQLLWHRSQQQEDPGREVYGLAAVRAEGEANTLELCTGFQVFAPPLRRPV